MNEINAAGQRLPGTITEYLAQLRAALHDADPAMVQDALYDAEEYLRAELAAQPGRDESEVIADVAGSYGAPQEVADIYRETEITVNRALRTPIVSPRLPPRPVAAQPVIGDTAGAGAGAGTAAGPAGPAAGSVPPAATAPPSRPLLARFFGVALEARTYGALFYMLLSFATGTFFFVWVVTGLSLSLSLMLLIIGVPIAVLFFGSVRGLALLEGRLVEALLGERMPRRPLYADRSRSWLQRIGEMFTDSRTWLTLLYFMLMLPLGTIYFSIALSMLTTSLVLIWAPVTALFTGYYPGIHIDGMQMVPLWATPLMAICGTVLLFTTLHLARAVGKLHGMIAKQLLVRL